MRAISSHLLDLSENEPYGIRGAKVFVRFKTLSGKEAALGHFAIDPETVSQIKFDSVSRFSQDLSTSGEHVRNDDNP